MHWLFWGNLVFGFAIGLLTGMSKTPAVTGLLPLLFGFAGGSVIVLTVAEERTKAQQDLLGQEFVGFGGGIILGALIGAILRKKGYGLALLGERP